MPTVDPHEVRGRCCPACGRASGIKRERSTRPYSAGDVAAGAMFGLLGFLFAVLDRTRVRLRCGACGCQFPEPPGLVSMGIVWLVLASAAVAGAYLFAHADGAPENARALTVAAAMVVLLISVSLLVPLVIQRRRRFQAWRQRYQREAQPAGEAPLSEPRSP